MKKLLFIVLVVISFTAVSQEKPTTRTTWARILEIRLDYGDEEILLEEESSWMFYSDSTIILTKSGEIILVSPLTHSHYYKGEIQYFDIPEGKTLKAANEIHELEQLALYKGRLYISTPEGVIFQYILDTLWPNNVKY